MSCVRTPNSRAANKKNNTKILVFHHPTVPLSERGKYRFLLINSSWAFSRIKEYVISVGVGVAVLPQQNSEGKYLHIQQVVKAAAASQQENGEGISATDLAYTSTLYQSDNQFTLTTNS